MPRAHFMSSSKEMSRIHVGVMMCVSLCTSEYEYECASGNACAHTLVALLLFFFFESVNETNQNILEYELRGKRDGAFNMDGQSV